MGCSFARRQFQGISLSQRDAGQPPAIFAMTSAMLQCLMHQHRQSVEPLAHIGRAACQEYPCQRGKQEHRASTLITRDSASASTDASTVSRTPDGSSILIRPRPNCPTTGAGKAAAGSAIWTSPKLGWDGTVSPVNAPDIACRRQV